MYSYFNIEQIQMSDIEIMISAYGLSGLSGSWVRSKYIIQNTYSGRSNNLRSKPIPIHGPAHKYDLNHSYSRSHFSRLPQALAKTLIYRLSQ